LFQTNGAATRKLRGP